MSTGTDEAVEPNETTDPAETDERDETPGLEPDDEPDDPDDDDLPAEPITEPSGHSEKWWEKAWAASERENERHAGRVQQIFEEEAQEFEQCPMCLGGPSGWLTVTAFADDHAALIRAKLGMDDPTTLEPMRGAVECETCKGKGKVRTPSQVFGYQTLMCPDCRQADPSGRQFATGWRYVAGPNDPARPEYATVQVTAAELAATPAAAQVAGNGDAPVIEMPYDAWSRPVGHPHFGVPPADVGV